MERLAFRKLWKGVVISQMSATQAFERARALHAAGRLQEAIDGYTALLGKLTDKGFVHFLRGQAAYALGRLEEAEADFRAQLALTPEHPQTYEFLGDALRNLGRLEDSFQAYETLTRLAPEDSDALFRAALARKTVSEDGFFKRLQSFVEEAPLTAERASAGFGLAKALSDLGRDDQQMAVLHRANAALRRSYTFDLQQVEQQFDLIKKVFSAEALQKAVPIDVEAAPIFIVGMPRSGSTLTESILAAMPGVTAGGELTTLSETLGAYEQAGGRADALPGAVPQNRVSLAQIYTNAVRQRFPGAERFTDKMLGNFALIGVIRLILPRASIVQMRRNRLDMAWSIYSNHFLGTLHPYAYDLAELGGYIALYEDLMSHWRDLDPQALHIQSYEALVGDSEGESRRLADFCDLDWSQDCLKADNRSGAHWTRSSDQVRNPISMAGVGRGQARADMLSAFTDGYEAWRERLGKKAK